MYSDIVLQYCIRILYVFSLYLKPANNIESIGYLLVSMPAD